jgi:hypothetical protein
MKTTDYLIIALIGYLLFIKKGIGAINKRELKKGIKIEKEHKAVIDKLYKRKVKPAEAYRIIATEHLKENPKYYSQLTKLLK